MTERQRGRLYVLIESTGEGCWEWSAGKDTSGYGQLYVGPHASRKKVGAHRLVWMLANPLDTLGPGECICHHCDNPPCCRVDHLFRSTHAGNSRDKIKKGRAGSLWGEAHPHVRLTEANVYEIRDSKERYKVLAARFRVSVDHVNDIKRRLRWRHLEENDLEALFGDN